MTRRTRAKLKEIFSAGALPDETDFHDDIESVINSLDDRIVKQDGATDPLKIESWGPNQNMLDLFAFGDGTASWRIKGKPAKSSSDPATVTGLDISSSDQSRLFIKKDDGKIGMATREPTAHLHVRSDSGEALRLDSSTDANTAPDMVIKANGKTGFGTLPADDAAARVTVKDKLKSDSLQVVGNSDIGGDLTVNGDLHIKGTSKHVMDEIHHGNVVLGDEDTDQVTFEGKIVSGNSTDKLEIDDRVHITDNTHIGGKLGVGTTTSSPHLNQLDVSGNAAVGSAYAAAGAAPANGLLVEGSVGIGTNSPDNKVDISGNAAIGSSYAGSRTAPANGLLVEGNVGVGSAAPVSKMDISGNASIGGSYAGTNAAPANGLLVEGKVGVGSTAPVSKVDISGNASIGSSYAGTNAAPTAGLVVEGNVGVGTTAPTNKLDVSGNAVIGAAYAGNQTAPANGLLVEGHVGMGKQPAADVTLAVEGKIEADDLDLSGNLDIDGNLTVGGNTSLGNADTDTVVIHATMSSGHSSDRLEISDKVHISDNTHIDGKVGIGTGSNNPANKLDVSGAAVIGSGYAASQTAPTNGLLVEGPAGFGKSPATGEALAVAGKATITGDADIGGNLVIEGNLEVKGASKHVRDEIHHGNVILGDADTDTVTFEGKLVSGNSTDNIEINDTLHVSEKVGIGTQTPVNKLDVSGAAVIGNTYAAAKTAPRDGLLVQGKVGIGKEPAADVVLAVEGKVEADNLDLSANLTVEGNATLGNADADRVSINGTISSTHSSGALKIDDALDVSGNAALAADLSIAGSMSLATGSSVNAIKNSIVWAADNRDESSLVNTRAVMDYIDSLFVGTISAYAAGTAPSGWLECDGAEVSRITYQRLFDSIGTTFGAGDGSTTFKLPDLRGQFIRGWNKENTGSDPNRSLGSGQNDMVREHSHRTVSHRHTITTGVNGVTVTKTGSHTHKYEGPKLLTGASGTAPVVAVTSGDDLKYDLTSTQSAADKPVTNAPSSTHGHSISGNTDAAGAGKTSNQDTGNPGAETRPANVALMYCIKY